MNGLLKITKAKTQTPKKTQRLSVLFPDDWPFRISLDFVVWDLEFIPNTNGSG
jgi:hypothetical protein